MIYQSRTTAVQGQYVRLYCPFSVDGIPCDPSNNTPIVRVGTNETPPTYSGSSSSYSDENPVNDFGPFTAKREMTGLWYVDWLVPDDLAIGQWFDTWNWKWGYGDNVPQSQTFAFDVATGDTHLPWEAPVGNIRFSQAMTRYISDFNNAVIWKPQHLEVNWEQGWRDPNKKVVSFGFRNWNTDPKPMVRLNNRLVDGWTADYNGRIVFDRNLDPEDNVFCAYNFRFFSDQEVMTFLNLGLNKMNAVPPVSEIYSSLGSAPAYWKIGILSGAAEVALQRLLMGMSFQEDRIILGEDGQAASEAIATFRQMYADFKSDFEMFAKNTKTLKLPGIAQIIQPEFTLPGGRSRWFRYMMKGS